MLVGRGQVWVYFFFYCAKNNLEDSYLNISDLPSHLYTLEMIYRGTIVPIVLKTTLINMKELSYLHINDLPRDLYTLEITYLGTSLGPYFNSFCLEGQNHAYQSCLPPLVPNFTGRQSECEEIVGHVTSQFTRIVSVSGPRGFGKTTVTTKVGHILESHGLPVYWITLRGLQSKTDLTSKLLSFVRQTLSHHQISNQRLSLNDELCQLFDEISECCVFILDDADDLLESGLPNVKEEVIGLLEEILRRNEKVPG